MQAGTASERQSERCKAHVGSGLALFEDGCCSHSSYSVHCGDQRACKSVGRSCEAALERVGGTAGQAMQ